MSILALTALLLPLALTVVGPQVGGGSVAEAQTQTPTVKLLNPSQAYDPNYARPPRAPGTVDPVKVSDKFDGVDSLYHIVALTQNAPPDAILEVYIDPERTDIFGNDFEPEQTIGLLTRVPGAIDTWELYWDIPENMDPGGAPFRVRMYSDTGAGVEEIANDEVRVELDQPRSGDAGEETVEIVWPPDNGSLGFYKGRGGAWRTVIDGTMSPENTQQLRVSYTTSRPGTAQTYTQCASANFTRGTTALFRTWRVTCPLATGTNPSQVTAIAAIAGEDDNPNEQCSPTGDCPGSAVTDPQQTLESADVHRVTPYIQTPGQSTIDILPNPNSQAPALARTLANTGCLSFIARVRDQLNRPVQGANIDVHVTGPTDSLAFGEEASPSTGNTTSNSKKPDKGTHPSEFFWDCDFPPDREDDGTEDLGNVLHGEHNLPGRADIKHLETTAGSGISGGGGVGAGDWRFHLRSSDPGLTTMTAWIDDEDISTEAENRPEDNDALDLGEPADTDIAQWYPAAPQVLIDPLGDVAATGECNPFTVRIRAGSAVVPGINVDVHATGPDDQLDFCSIPGVTDTRQAPDLGEHAAEDSEEATHAAGAPPHAQHSEGQTDDFGNLIIGITSPAAGDTTLTAWIDGEVSDGVPFNNDVQDSAEAAGTATNSWLVPGVVKLSFLNPSPYGPTAPRDQSTDPRTENGVESGDMVSTKNDIDALYHVVVRADGLTLPIGLQLEVASGSAATTGFAKIADMTRIGTSDAYEAFWNVPAADGPFTLRASIPATATAVTKTVTVNNTDTATDPSPHDPQAETVEITSPVDGASAPFAQRVLTIRGTASSGADGVDFFYTKVGAKDTPAATDWIHCGFVTLGTNKSFTGGCTLASGDIAPQVMGIAALAYDCNVAGTSCTMERNQQCAPPSTASTCRSEGNRESGDAHRVFGFDANPRFEIEPAEAAANTGVCQKFTVTLRDASGQPLGNVDIDLHLTGPSDNSAFCEPPDQSGSSRSAPDAGGHADLGTGEGSHDSPTGPDTRHTEGRTDVTGRFVVGITSADPGDANVLGWVDHNNDDVQQTEEPQDTSIMHWGSEGGCTVSGTEGDDSLTGTDGPDRICAFGGNDVINALAGDDQVLAGPGVDYVVAAAGNDFVRAGKSSDDVAGGRGNDTLIGGGGNDRLHGGAGEDRCSGGRGRDLVERCEGSRSQKPLVK